MSDLQIFENHNIRITEVDGDCRMAAVDACKALGYIYPCTNWDKLKRLHADLMLEVLSVKLVGNDGYSRDTDTLDIEGVILLCMFAKTEKAYAFRKWAKKALAKKESNKIVVLENSEKNKFKVKITIQYHEGSKNAKDR